MNTNEQSQRQQQITPPETGGKTETRTADSEQQPGHAPKPQHLDRKMVEKNLPADPDPDDPVSP
jgi:hypothetical protein